jgi:hypothetical protein
VNLCFQQVLFRNLSRWTQTSEVIMLISSENNSRRFHRTPEAKPPKKTMRRCRVGLAGLWGPLLASSFECWFSTTLGFASTPSFQVSLIRGLRIDATAYIYQPLPPSLRHQTLISHSVKKAETLINRRAPPYSRA